MLKAVLFDIDGTLVDTESFQYQGWIETLRPYGIELSKEEYLDYAGKCTTDIEALVISRHNLGANKGELLAKKRKLVSEWFNSQKLSPMPYAKEAISFFRSRGLKLAAVSGSQQTEADLKVRQSDLSGFFSTVIGVEGSLRSKPYPDLYLKALRLLDAGKSECIVFEDASYGVLAAKGAGIFTIAIPTDFTIGQDFSKADHLCSTLKEAVDLVKDRYSL